MIPSILPVSSAGLPKNQGLINPLDGMHMELGRKRLMGVVVLGRHQHSGGVFIQPVNDPGA